MPASKALHDALDQLMEKMAAENAPEASARVTFTSGDIAILSLSLEDPDPGPHPLDGFTPNLQR